MADLAGYIRDRCDVPPEEIAWLAGQAQLRKLPRRAQFCRIGQADHEIAYVESGILQTFVMAPDGRRIVLDFSFPGGWVVALETASRDLPSQVCCEAVTPCVLTIFPFELRKIVVTRHRGWERLAARMTEEAFIRKQHRYFSLRTRSAEERYANLAAELSAGWQEIPQQSLASYLDITPQYLSAIKRKCAADSK
jgi:CRP-like cAMP-binding protein